MNEFERRFLEVAQNHVDLREISAAFTASADVEYFGYSLTLGSQAAPLTNGTPFQGVIPIQSDAYFVMQYISTAVCLPATATNGGLALATNTLNVLLQVTDTGSGEILYNRQSPAGILTGNPSAGMNGIPLLLPIPRILLPNTNIKVEVQQNGVTALSNTEPVGFYFSILGARVALI